MTHSNDVNGLAALYRDAIRRHPEAEEVNISLPEGDPNIKYLLGDFHQFRGTASYMISITYLTGFLMQIGPLKGIGTGRLELTVYNDVRWLEPVAVNLKDFMRTEKPADVKLILHQTTLMRIISGLDSLQGALEAGLMEVSGVPSHLMASLESLFHPSCFRLWPADHWRQTSTSGFMVMLSLKKVMACVPTGGLRCYPQRARCTYLFDAIRTEASFMK